MRDRFSGTFAKWNAQSRQMAASSDSVSSALRTQGLALTAIAGVGTVALGSLVKAFGDVEDRLRELEVVTTPTFQSLEEALERSLQRATEFSSRFIFSTEQVIGASFELASAGLNVEETIEGIEQAAFLAAAGLGDLRQTAILMGSSFNTVGKAGELQFLTPLEKAKKIADSTALAVKKFQITLPILQEGLKFTVGPAAQLGVSLDELNATLGLLNTLGLRASIAGTVLSNIFAKMSVAVEKLGLDTSKFLNDAGELTSLADFLQQVEAALPTASFARFSKLIEVFGIRAARGVVALISNVDALRDHTKELNQGAGSAEKFGGTIANSLNKQMKVFSNNLENVKASLGRAFAARFKDLLSALNLSISAFREGASGLGIFISAVLAVTVVGAVFRAAMIGIAFAAGTAGRGLLGMGANAFASSGLVALAIGSLKLFRLTLNLLAPDLISIALNLAAFASVYFLLIKKTNDFASSLDFANTSLEGVSTSITRVISDLTKLDQAFKTSVPDIGRNEALAFGDLIDFRDRERLDRELRLLSDEEVQIKANFGKANRALDTFFGLSESLNVALIPGFPKAPEKLVDPVVLPADFDVSDANKRLDAIEKRKLEIVAALDIKTAGAEEILKLQERLLNTTPQERANSALRSVSRTLANLVGDSSQATVRFRELKNTMARLGLASKDTVKFLSELRKQIDASLKFEGVDLGAGKIEKFLGDVKRSRGEFEELAKSARETDIEAALAFPPNVAAEAQAAFNFFKDNLEQIRKIAPDAADAFESNLRLPTGEFVKLDRIVQGLGANLEEAGQVEATFFTGDLERSTSAIFAAIALDVEGKLRGALDRSTQRALKLAEAMVLTKEIDGNLQSLQQFEERLAGVRKVAEKQGGLLGPKTLAEEASILSEQERLIDSALGKIRASIKAQETILATTQLDEQAKAAVNKELTAQLQNQNKLLDKQSQVSKESQRVRDTFIEIARAQLPELNLPPETKKLIESGGAFEFSFQLERRGKAKLTNELQQLTGKLNSLLTLEKNTLGIRIEAEKAGATETLRDVNRTISRLRKVIGAAKKRIESVEFKIRNFKVDTGSLDIELEKARAAAKAAGGLVLDISTTKLDDLKADLGEALREGFRQGRVDGFAKSLGAKIRASLVGSITKSLADAFGLAFALGDVAAAGKKIGELLASGASAGSKEVQAALKPVLVGLKRIGAVSAGTGNKFASVGSNLGGAFDEGVKVLRQIEQEAKKATGGLVDLSAASAQALAPLTRDVAALLTKFQLATGATKDFIGQIIDLRKGEGIVAGISLSGADLNVKLKAALDLARQMKDLRIGGDAFRELEKAITEINEQIESARKGGTALTGAVSGAAKTVSGAAKAASRTVKVKTEVGFGGFDKIKEVVRELKKTPVELLLEADLEKLFQQVAKTPVPIKVDSEKVAQQLKKTPVEVLLEGDFKKLLEQAKKTPVELLLEADLKKLFRQVQRTPVEVLLEADLEKLFQQARRTPFQVFVEGNLDRLLAEAKKTPVEVLLEADLKRFLEQVGEIKKTPVTLMLEADLSRFLGKLEEKGVTSKSPLQGTVTLHPVMMAPDIKELEKIGITARSPLQGTVSLFGVLQALRIEQDLKAQGVVAGLELGDGIAKAAQEQLNRQAPKPKIGAEEIRNATVAIADLANQIGGATEAVRTLGTDITGIFKRIAAIRPADVSKFVLDAIAGVRDQVLKLATSIGVNISAGFRAGVDKSGAAIGKLIGAMESLGNAAKGAATVVGAALQSIAGTVADVGASVGKNLGAGFDKVASAIIGVGSKVTGTLASALKALVGIGQEIGTNLKSATDTGVGALEDFLGAVGSTLVKAIDATSDSVRTLGSLLAKNLAAAANSAAEAFTNLATATREQLTKVLDNINSQLEALGDRLATALTQKLRDLNIAVNIDRASIEQAIGFINRLLERLGVFEAIRTVVGFDIRNAPQLLAFLNQARESITSATAALRRMQEFFDRIKTEALVRALNIVIPRLISLGEAIATAIAPALSKFANNVLEAGGALAQGFGQSALQVVQSFAEVLLVGLRSAEEFSAEARGPVVNSVKALLEAFLNATRFVDAFAASVAFIQRVVEANFAPALALVKIALDELQARGVQFAARFARVFVELGAKLADGLGSVGAALLNVVIAVASGFDFLAIGLRAPIRAVEFMVNASSALARALEELILIVPRATSKFLDFIPLVGETLGNLVPDSIPLFSRFADVLAKSSEETGKLGDRIRVQPQSYDKLNESITALNGAGNTLRKDSISLLAQLDKQAVKLGAGGANAAKFRAEINKLATEFKAAGAAGVDAAEGVEKLRSDVVQDIRAGAAALGRAPETAFKDAIATARETAKELELDIGFDRALAGLGTFRDALTELATNPIRIDFDFDRSTIREVTDLLREEFGIADEIEEANRKMQDLRAETRRVKEEAASIKVGTTTAAATIQTSPDTGDVSIQIGDALVNVDVQGGGLTTEAKDEILRRVGEALSAQLEGIRSRLDDVVREQNVGG